MLKFFALVTNSFSQDRDAYFKYNKSFFKIIPTLKNSNKALLIPIFFLHETLHFDKFQVVITKTVTDHKRAQASTNEHKPPTKDHLTKDL